MKHLLKKLLVSIILLLVSTGVFCQWEELDSISFYITEIKSLDEALYVGTTNDGIYMSEDYGYNWHNLNNTGLNSLRISSLAFADTWMIVGTWEGIYRSDDGGQTYSFCSASLPDQAISELIYFNNYIFAVSWGGGIFRSSDYGQNWEIINNGLTTLIFKSIYGDNSGLYAGSVGDGIFYSDDYGISWEPRNIGIPTDKSSEKLISKVNCIYSQNNFVYASITGVGIVVSIDSGLNWTVLDVVNYYIWDFCGYDNNLFAGHDGAGFSKSMNNGIDWEFDNEGIQINYDDKIVLAVHVFNENVYIGTRTGRIFTQPISTLITSINEYVQSHSKAFPNPFTTATTIEYELKIISDIQFTVYNMMGERVHHAEYSSMPPGSHKVTWSPSHLPGGMYYAVLRSEDGVSVVKMVKE